MPDSTPKLHVLLDGSGTVLRVGEGEQRLPGPTNWDPTGDPVWNMLPHVSSAFFRQQVQTLYQVPQVIWTTRYEVPQSEPRLVRIDAQLARRNPDVVRYDLTFPEENDVQHRLYRMIADRSGEVGWFWDFLRGKFIVTASFYKTLGLEPEAVPETRRNLTTLLTHLLPVGELARLNTLLRETRAGNPSPQSDRFRLDDGRTLHYFAEPVSRQETLYGVRGTLAWHPTGEPDAGMGETFQTLPLPALLFNEQLEILQWNNLAYERWCAPSEPRVLTDLDAERSAADWRASLRELRDGTLRVETQFRSENRRLEPVELHVVAQSSGTFLLVGYSAGERRRREAELNELKLEVESLRKQLAGGGGGSEEPDSGGPNIISRSKQYEQTLELIRQVAPTDSTVLILGETGTGKELLARSIHHHSRRSERQLVRVNCATLAENLIESELFGHERGAFTGATQRKPGRFELADEGSIFLDEIGEISLTVQTKLLRVLQEGEFERVGGTKTLVTDVRVIAATNRDLEKMVGQGKFRADLYYRLNVFPIVNPPLRDRPEDVEPLVRHFVEKYNVKTGRAVRSIAPDDLQRLREYDFPGNVRELEHLIERAVILSSGDKLNLGPLPRRSALGTKAEFATLEGMTRRHIEEALRRTRGRVSGKGGAAELLDVNAQTLYSKIRKLGIERE